MRFPGVFLDPGPLGANHDPGHPGRILRIAVFQMHTLEMEGKKPIPEAYSGDSPAGTFRIAIPGPGCPEHVFAWHVPGTPRMQTGTRRIVSRMIFRPSKSSGMGKGKSLDPVFPRGKGNVPRCRHGCHCVRGIPPAAPSTGNLAAVFAFRD